MSLGPGIHEAAGQLIALLDRLKAPYAVGGAVAMAFSGFVRATRDLDVLALVPAVRYEEFAAGLAEAGFVMHGEDGASLRPDPVRMAADGRELGHFRVWLGDTRVEVFCPKVPLQDAILKRRVRVELGDFAMWITTPEDLVVLKMIFHRPKDLEDARRIIAANRDRLDVGYIRDQAARTLEARVSRELEAMLAA